MTPPMSCRDDLSLTPRLSSPFAIGAHQYITDSYGVIHQLQPEPITYDGTYIHQHRDKPLYTNRAAALSHMRIGMVLETVGREPISVLDYGYGDGEFLRHVSTSICDHLYGLDPACWPLHHGHFVSSPVPAEIYTMWDVMEHLPELELLRTLPCHFLAVSVPDASGKDLANWKHLRPNEHLHHFGPASLASIMLSLGWRQLWSGHPEDIIRGGPDNILSAGFARA